jgi:hypothetical protein
MLATQQEAQVFFFFPFFPRVLEKSFWVERKKETYSGAWSFFGTPLYFFLSFFLLELRVPPGE